MGNERGVLCEVCIDSVAGALAAEQGGADRVELCANLVEGGTTPSTGMIRSVLAAVHLPVMVMIRPRGGHFTFDESERSVMRRDAEAVLAEPVAGIVIGALDDQGRIDQVVCAELCAMAAGRSVTFHRAFDQVADPAAALEQLVALRVDRILTSGLAPSALQGLPLLTELVQQAQGRISIMPGCGVRAENIARILAESGAGEIHFSGSAAVPHPVSHWRPEVPMSSVETPGDLVRRVTTAESVAAICQAARCV